jgi:hypothetical protein
MIDEWWTAKDLEKSGSGLWEVQSWNLPGGTEENHENLSIAGVLAGIWTKHLPNTGLQNYL